MLQLSRFAPMRFEFGTRRENCENRQCLQAVDEHSDQLFRGRIDPVQILDDQQHRTARGESFQQAQQSLKQLLLLPLR